MKRKKKPKKSDILVSAKYWSTARSRTRVESTCGPLPAGWEDLQKKRKRHMLYNEIGRGVGG